MRCVIPTGIQRTLITTFTTDQTSRETRTVRLSKNTATSGDVNMFFTDYELNSCCFTRIFSWSQKSHMIFVILI